MMEPANKEIARLQRFIAKGAAEIVETQSFDKLVLESSAHGTISATPNVVKFALSQGLGALSKGKISISDAGRSRLRRLECTNDPYAGQHRSDVTIAIADESGSMRVRSNDAESPLAMLRNRKDTKGLPLIDDEAFKAGERLRSDFTLGNLVPSIGVNWDVTGSGSRANGVLEITDAALAARQRVERPLEAVGPELSGALIDVCCFLKGLETVERERQWPVRSAKLILKTALAVLDRHYHPPALARRKMRIIHWGTEDYRPEVRN
ncbi:DUF6456 domain-containing protein [Phyllobacterium sp. P5_D12]